LLLLLCFLAIHIAHERTVAGILAGKFDIANMANNHIADYGSIPIMDTFKLLKKNRISFVGAGENLKKAQKVLTKTCKGRKLSFLSFAENEFCCADKESAGAWPLDVCENARLIRKAADTSDITIVLIHGGNEYNPVPSPRMISTYRFFAEAGADAVIGTHPHVPQGHEVYNGIPIIYSIGNFIFDDPDPYPMWSKSYLARLTFRETKPVKIDIIPFEAEEKTGYVQLIKGDEKKDFIRYIRYLSALISKPEESGKYWDGWCALMGPGWLRRLNGAVYPFSSSEEKQTFLKVRNQLMCEAHHELLSTYMELIRNNKLTKARAYIPKVKQLMKGEIPK
ncbi:CapA family protein, partial [Planctomycetota bacterium]